MNCPYSRCLRSRRSFSLVQPTRPTPNIITYLAWQHRVGVARGAAQGAVEVAECSGVVQDAQALVAKGCGQTGRNPGCYGNISLKAEPQSGVSDLKFSEPGHKVDVFQVRQLELSSLDTDAGTWGMALMRIQANLPDTAKGQNVTVLLFGDVQ